MNNIKELLLTSRKIDEITECRNWTGRINSDGYGVISLKLENDTRNYDYRVHRLSFTEFKGILNKFALHKCNNKKCFNPEHLYDGDESDNAIDLIESGNHKNMYGKTNRTHCSKGHLLVKPNLVWWGGRRICRTCANQSKKDRRNKAKIL